MGYDRRHHRKRWVPMTVLYTSLPSKVVLGIAGGAGSRARSRRRRSRSLVVPRVEDLETGVVRDDGGDSPGLGLTRGLDDR